MWIYCYYQIIIWLYIVAQAVIYDVDVLIYDVDLI